MKTNVNLIQFLSDNNLLRQYACFLKLKQIHVNSCFYNNNKKAIATDAGISRNTAIKYTKFFLANKWAVLHNNNLCLISHDNLKKLYEIKQKHDIKVENGTTQEVVNNLQYEILKLKNKKFNFVKQLIQDRNNPRGADALKSHKKALKFFKDKTPYNIGAIGYSVSTKKLSSFINRSRTTVINLIKKKVLEKKAQIIKSPAIRRLCLVPNEASYWLKSNEFIFGRFIYTIQCNQYVFA